MAAKFSSAAAARGASGSRSEAPEASGRLRTADFDALYRHGIRRTATHFLVLARPNDRGVSRFGLSVRSSLGGAVVRNRIKRRIRAILQRARAQVPTGWDIVVQPRSGQVAQAAFATLQGELTHLLASLPGQ